MKSKVGPTGGSHRVECVNIVYTEDSDSAAIPSVYHLKYQEHKDYFVDQIINSQEN